MTPGLLRLVLASANPDKAKEIAPMLSAALRWMLLPRPRDRARRRRGRRHVGRQRPPQGACVGGSHGQAAVADDTGLEVDALGGAPGVYSARYAGESATYADNVAKLLRELAALPDGGGARRARFRTVALVAFPDGSEVWAEGVVRGHHRGRGPGRRRVSGTTLSSWPEGGDGRTFAEMLAGEKDAVSHRGRAFRALATELARRQGGLSW